MQSWIKLFAVAIIFIAHHSTTEAQAGTEITVEGNRVEAVIELTDGVSADLTITFENAVGLSPESLGLSAEIIDITDLSILDRLPDPLNVSMNAAFPMLITIEPPANQGFSFSGVASIDIHTHNLEYTTNTPLRFMKAPLNGEFRDFTMTVGSGSYRARGTTGKFSQFLIATDLRPLQWVISDKLTRLQNELNNAQTELSLSIYNDLSQQLAAIEQAINSDNYAQADGLLGDFIKYIKQQPSIPNVWRSSRDVNNIAGELVAHSQTLRFSLRRNP